MDTDVRKHQSVSQVISFFYSMARGLLIARYRGEKNSSGQFSVKDNGFIKLNHLVDERIRPQCNADRFFYCGHYCSPKDDAKI